MNRRKAEEAATMQPTHEDPQINRGDPAHGDIAHDDVDIPVEAGSLADAVQRLESAGLCGGPGQLPCQDAHELIHHYLDTDCDQELRARIQGHLERCPSCDSEFAVYTKIVTSLSKCRSEIPEDAAERIKDFCAKLSSGDLI